MKKAVLLLGLLSLVLSGCVVGVRPMPGVAVVVHGPPPVEYGYEPILYNGYVVYYTDDGLPYYWAGGVQVWIPDHERGYYVTHWRSHRRAYREWYHHRGHEYRNQRYQLKRAKKHHQLKKVEEPQERPVLKKADEPSRPRPHERDDFKYDEEGRIINDD